MRGKQQESDEAIEDVSDAFQRKRKVAVDPNKELIVSRPTPYSPVPLLNYNMPFQFNNPMCQGLDQNNIQPFVVYPMMMINPMMFPRKD